MLTAFVQQSEKQKIDIKADEKAIRSLSMKWLELQNQKDFAGVAPLFDDDGIMYQMNQKPIIGQTTIRKYLSQELEQNPKMIANWTADRIEIAASGDLAIEYGSWTATGLGLTGTEEDYCKSITVYRKKNGV